MLFGQDHRNKRITDCDETCTNSMRNEYFNLVKECPGYCKKYGSGMGYTYCMEKCKQDCQNDAYRWYENCIRYCEANFEAYNQKFPWLKGKKWLFSLYVKRSRQYGVPLKLALSLITYESGGRNVISRKNRNGTRDYGRMQINSVHMPRNPRALLNDWVNSQKGFWYLGAAMKKAHGNIYTAVRLYNQGLAGKHWKYRNWGYVNNIVKKYRSVI